MVFHVSSRLDRNTHLARWAAGIAFALMSFVSRAGELAYEPVALGWTAEEVQQAAHVNYDAIVDRARAAQRFGCQRHCEQLHRVFARLVVEARSQSARAHALPWSLTVVRLDDLEAMALPGGQVVISEAFIDANALGDDALAFVLAHEMAHSILEHERQSLTFARMLLPAVPRSVNDMYTEMDMNFSLLKSMELVMQAGEYEADELGLLMASEAGFSPEGQLRFLIGESLKPAGAKPLVATHPPATDRLEKLRVRLPLAWRLKAQHRELPRRDLACQGRSAGKICVSNADPDRRRPAG
jgi:predicted Zn-dependent protease